MIIKSVSCRGPKFSGRERKGLTPSLRDLDFLLWGMWGFLKAFIILPSPTWNPGNWGLFPLRDSRFCHVVIPSTSLPRGMESYSFPAYVKGPSLSPSPEFIPARIRSRHCGWELAKSSSWLLKGAPGIQKLLLSCTKNSFQGLFHVENQRNLMGQSNSLPLELSCALLLKQGALVGNQMTNPWALI